ncbi:AbrB/MazE/SpoVT family DNA-binding domain-containing protein [Rhodopirellula bahusiensis]|uniref:AbrB/MazE/SpoVT family DNA-binding domain-containing protein n=1 Tax=Rhodopirellula bahusiensis TaxID=2014065 RepID=UPI003267A93A
MNTKNDYHGGAMELGTPEEVWNCRIDSSGRIMLPKAMRAERHWDFGDEISLCLVDDEVVLQRTEDVLETLVKAFRTQLPDDCNLVQELIDERRAEAAREASH